MDDFTGPAGETPNTAIWNYELGGDGWGNAELENYTNSPSNASLDGKGDLAITARADTAGDTCWYGSCRYTSARLQTSNKFDITYGRIEARIKIPSGMGLWPAFWMLGQNIDTVPWPGNGEIDIMENIGREPGVIYGSIHGPGYENTDSQSATYALPNGEVFSSEFHIFAVDWTPKKLTFSVDGTPYETRTRATVGDNKWVFDHPFYIILNLAVGGGWPGPPDSSTRFPASMLVDYVAAYTESN